MGQIMTVGIDVGGTKIAAGLVDDRGTVVARRRSRTPGDDGERILDQLADMVAQLECVSPEPVSSVGIAAAGIVDSTRSNVVFAANIPAWRDEPIAKRLRDRIGIPVVVENDANAAGWAEAVFGAGRGQLDQVCVTVGTGIGGAIILGGELQRGRWGFGAEVGHMIVQPNGYLCACGARGCWETYASGSALLREARRLAISDPRSAATMLALGDTTPQGITGEHVTVAAGRGDPAALAAYSTCGTWLGRGVAALATLLDPAVVVIAGGVADAGETLLGPARSALGETLFAGSRRVQPTLARGTLSADAGVLGVADLARLHSVGSHGDDVNAPTVALPSSSARGRLGDAQEPRNGDHSMAH
jgi:glucokinase